MEKDGRNAIVAPIEIPVVIGLVGGDRNIYIEPGSRVFDTTSFIGSYILSKLESVANDPEYPDKTTREQVIGMLDGYFEKTGGYFEHLEILKLKQEKRDRRKQKLSKIAGFFAFKGLNRQGQLARDVSG